MNRWYGKVDLEVDSEVESDAELIAGEYSAEMKTHVASVM
jgi:hypothetical protein